MIQNKIALCDLGVFCKYPYDLHKEVTHLHIMKSYYALITVPILSFVYIFMYDLQFESVSLKIFHLFLLHLHYMQG